MFGPRLTSRLLAAILIGTSAIWRILVPQLEKQPHRQAVDWAGESRGDIHIIADLQRRLLALYTKEVGAFPEY